jgi:serine/threonine protein kinase
MVMALVEGETLDRKLKRDGRLPQTDVDRLLGPLLDGLEQLHAAGFLHRDIKPANIIVDTAGQPTLIDFGAARAAMSGRTQTLTAVFTPGYAPIEQFTSGRQGPFTDIYALGATLYQCVTGVVPPSAIDRVVGVELAQIAAALRSEYTPNLWAGIDAALVPTAVDRPQRISGTATGHSARLRNWGPIL